LEAVSVDLHVFADEQVGWGDEVHLVVHVLVLLSLQEGSLDDSGVLLSWLEDGDGVVGQVEGDDESSVEIFWDSSVELGSESQDLLVIVNVFEEVSLWLVWQELEHISERVNFVSESVVWWDNYWSVFSWLWHFDLTKLKVLSILLFVEGLGENVNTLNFKFSSECVDSAIWFNLIAG
jgi:hypothetical protein